MIAAPSFNRLQKALDQTPQYTVYGKIAQIVGLVIESNGPEGRIGDLCSIEKTQSASLPRSANRSIVESLMAEIVGFRGDRVLLMPLGELDGIGPGSLVRNTDECLQVPTGAGLLGRTIDALGNPIDGLGEIEVSSSYPILASPPNPLSRRKIHRPLATGVRVIDGMLTLGEGQRLGIFSGSGVGKSTLLGMIARNCEADVNVIALVGERGREVREFIDNDLGEEGLRRSVIVCATSDQPALLRIKAALAATAIAESFRDEGKSVLLMMDSITRFAMAQREVGLAVGEPPSTKGYTPSVFALLPRLMERAGNSDKGAITALYTVLVEGDDTNEPIADTARSILDGHIVLNRKLTSKGHYPPVDVLASLSRTMPFVVAQPHIESARQIREWVGAYDEVEDLVAIGAYKEGSKPTADRAIAQWDDINRFLRQDKAEGTPFDECAQQMQELTNEDI